MSGSKSPSNSIADMHFSSDDEYRRPRRTNVNRGAFVEEGTDSDEPGPSNKRKQAKKSKSVKKQPPAKKLKIGFSSESDSDDDMKDKDSKMKNLTEKERELMIFRHIEQQELMKTRKQIQQKLLGDDDTQEEKPKAAKPDKESGEESSSSSDGEVAKKGKSDEEESDIELDTEFHRPSDLAKKIEKKQAIADLIKTRKEKRLQEEKRNETLDVNKVFGNDSDSDGSSSSDSSGSDSEDSDDDRRRSSPDVVKGEPISEASHLNQMKMSRFRLAKLCHAPFFEKTVLGCFVRVGVGVSNGQQVYRAGQVIGVVQTAKQYNVENVRTDKGLKLKHGADERVYRLEFISNSLITDKEFAKWKDHMITSKLPLPTIAFADKKQADINLAINYTFTDADVKSMVNENLKFKTAPTNYAVHKGELMKSKMDAEQRKDYEKALSYQNEIDKIDELIKKRDRELNQEGVAITYINQRNREIQRQTIAQIKPDNSSKEDDPFTRKSGKMRPVAGRAKIIDGIGGEAVGPVDKGDISTPATVTAMHHSISAPALQSFDPSMLFAAVPEKNVPTINTNNSTNNGSSKEGRLTLAEYRRRKAAAGK